LIVKRDKKHPIFAGRVKTEKPKKDWSKFEGNVGGYVEEPVK